MRAKFKMDKYLILYEKNQLFSTWWEKLFLISALFRSLKIRTTDVSGVELLLASSLCISENTGPTACIKKLSFVPLNLTNPFNRNIDNG